MPGETAQPFLARFCLLRVSVENIRACQWWSQTVRTKQAQDCRSCAFLFLNAPKLTLYFDVQLWALHFPLHFALLTYIANSPRTNMAYGTKSKPNRFLDLSAVRCILAHSPNSHTDWRKKPQLTHIGSYELQRRIRLLAKGGQANGMATGICRYPVPQKAETQGCSEEMVGQWMKERGNRDRVVVATKASFEAVYSAPDYILLSRFCPGFVEANFLCIRCPLVELVDCWCCCARSLGRCHRKN